MWCLAAPATLTPEQQRAEEYNRTMQKCVEVSITHHETQLELTGLAYRLGRCVLASLPVCACAANACGLLLRRKLSNPFQYHPELGLYYHEVAPGLLCGTQLRTPADVERLAGAHHFTCAVAFPVG